ncbi:MULTISPECIES: hypothetical protein [Serratia]|uniref:hypothetical protein n=1 Tax=Serratia TaxID=613 RepID=UPI00157254CD|nr:hypothetical protein [Serratia marcescens]MBH2634384.1 hypothetical protein [Serratia marcescens]NSM55744.1 hypothetical protein [Serratia marcescens]HAT3690830.1 hypothetical protein [Serratia marcescens]
MRDPISLDTAAFRASLLGSLFEVVMEKADSEGVSNALTDLISIAWGMSEEIRKSLDKEVGNV